MVISVERSGASQELFAHRLPIASKWKPRCSIATKSTGKFFLEHRIFLRSTSLLRLRLDNVVYNSCRNGRFLLAFKAFSASDDSASDSNHPLSLPSESAKVFKSAGLIGLATLTSKILGLLREIVVAAFFGVGPVATAFNHALVVPGFFASFLGGVNGPIHITVSATLSKLSKESRRDLIQHTHVVMLLGGAVLSSLVYMFSEFIIYVFAPGLWSVADNRVTQEIAVNQLKIMTPCILFSGSIGVGFGRLNAEGDNIASSLSPALSSFAIILSCLIYAIGLGSHNSHCINTSYGGLLLACGASLGSFLQWFIQVVMLDKSGYEFTSTTWQSILGDKDLYKMFVLILPAILSSGLAQVASFTDLYFASFIPGAAASLSYARLLAMAPLGITLSAIILPLVPNFSTLEKPSLWPRLKHTVQQAILLSMVIVLPIVSSICALAEPIISILFRRFAFDSEACTLVSSLLLYYSIGSPFYVIQELLVVVFYALGDGKQPFLITVAAILLNAFLDWLFLSQFGLGAQGLVLATSFVTAASAMVLICLLSRKLTGLVDLTAFVAPLVLLLACCLISGFTSSIAHKFFGSLLPTVVILRFCRLSELIALLLATLVGMLAFFFPLVILQFPGMKLVKDNLETIFS